MSSLIEDLWDEKRPKDAVHALQAHMYRLRSLLPLDIEYVNDGYRLVDDLVYVDAKQFANLYERGRSHLLAGEPKQAAVELDSALRLWRGPALTDIDDVLGVRPFALQLSTMRQAASDDRVEALLQCGAGESLINELRASLAIDPLQETTWHQLMRALWHAGQEAEAIAAYGQAREAFIDLLGTEPSSRLAQLHGQILTGTSVSETGESVSNVLVPGHSSAVDDVSRLVGRRDEMAVLEQAWVRSREGLHIVTLSGEPGIGKSRLSDEFARRVSGPEVLELRGRCDPAISLGYQPFADMLRDYLEFPPDSERQTSSLPPELTRILSVTGREEKDLRTEASQHTNDIDPHSVMAALAAWLSALSQHSSLLIRIDDVHWADEQTLLTLQDFLHSPRQINALIVLCMRDGHISAPEKPTLAKLLRQSERVTHLPLSRLSHEETKQLISTEAQRLPGVNSPPSVAKNYVLHASGGNPLFVVELSRQLLIHGAEGQLEIPAPPASVNSVIQGRIDGLPKMTQALMGSAAVVGAYFASVASSCATSLSTISANPVTTGWGSTGASAMWSSRRMTPCG